MWIFIILLLIFILLCCLSFYIAMYNKNDRDLTYAVLEGPEFEPYKEATLELINASVKIPCTRTVDIKAFDGTKLCARIYETDNKSVVHIMFHGFHGAALRDFCGALQLAFARKETIILVDQRAHGSSGGHVLTYGINERKDVLSWINYALDTYGPDTKIVLEGISMGAATVLMSLDQKLPENVVCVWADCPYSSPMEIIRSVGKMYAGPIGTLAGDLVYVAARIMGINLKESSAVEAVKNAEIPVAIIHGLADTLVPCEMSRRIQAENPDYIKLIEVPGAPHAESYMLDKETYIREYNALIDSATLENCAVNRG